MIILIRAILRRIYLIIFASRKHFLRNLVSSFGFLLSLIIIVMIFGVLRPIKKKLTDKIQSSLPSETIRIKGVQKKRNLALSLFFENRGDLHLGISRNKLNQIKKWPEVSKIQTTQIFQQTVMVSPEDSILSSFNIFFDAVIHGVDFSLVKPYLKCMRDFRPKQIIYNGRKTLQIPLVIPESISELIFSYATLQGFPGFNSKSLEGFLLSLRVGSSVIHPKEKHQLIIGKICGFVPSGVVAFLGAPLSWVKKEHLNIGFKNAESHFDKAFVTINSKKHLDSFKQKITKLGLKMPTIKNPYKSILNLLKTFDIIAWGLVIILVSLAIISLANTFALIAIEKRFEFGLYLVFGASTWFIWLVIFIEGSIWGGVHSFLALTLADYIFPPISELLAKYLPSLFSIEKPLLLAMTNHEKRILVIASIVTAGLSSLLPSIALLGSKTINLIKKD